MLARCRDSLRGALAACSLWLGLLHCAPAAEWLLDGATVHTISGQTLSPGQVLIRDDKIAAVQDRIDAPNASRIDLTGRHLYPGLIAAHTTLGLIEIEAVRATLDTTEVGDYTPEVRAWLAVNPDSELIPVARANGITHFEVLPYGRLLSGQSGVLTAGGWTTEDMTFKAPAAFHLYWPDMRLDTRPKTEISPPAKWKSLEDQAKERRNRLKELEEFFLDADAYAKARAASTNKTRVVPAWEALLPLVERKVPLVIHANESRQIKAALQWAQQRPYAVVLAGARDAAPFAETLAKAKIPVIFDHVFTLPPRDTARYDVHFETPAILHRAGVKVLLTQGVESDVLSQDSSLRNLPYAAAQAVAFGLPESEALKSITLYPAEVLGITERLGSIEPGKDATLIVLNGPLLDLRASVLRMWIAGKEVSLESRHTRLYDKYKNRPRTR